VTGLSPDALLGLARAYHAEVMVLDDALGRLLAAIDARDRREGRSTLVVATALHGEALGEHGALAEGASLYQEQLHVPLLFRWRGRLPAGIRLRTPLSLRVVAPTVAELAFVQFPSGQTRSVAAELRAGREPEARPVFAQRGPLTPDRVAPSTEEAVEELAVRRGRWKLIRDADGRGRLYDLESDPDELRDVAAEQPAVSGELDALLDQLMARNPPRFAGHRPAHIDAER
jgi:arylsulfatase A-like enzyme